jgi:hypothetical protein
MQKYFIQIFSVGLDTIGYSHNLQLQEEIDEWLEENPTATILGTSIAVQSSTVVVSVFGTKTVIESEAVNK